MTTIDSRATALDNASKSLQSLHHLLLRFQANQIGFDGSPLQLFDRAVNDRAFAWLKPLRDAIVALDDRRADLEPVTEMESEALRNTCRALLDTHSGPLAAKLKTAFQSDPETIWAINSARKALASVS